MLAVFCGLGALGAWIKHSRATSATDEASSRNHARSSTSTAGSDDDEDNDATLPAESASASVTPPPSIHLVERALRTHLRYFSPVNIALCALIVALALWLRDKESGVLATIGLVVAATSARTVSNALTAATPSPKSLK